MLSRFLIGGGGGLQRRENDLRSPVMADVARCREDRVKKTGVVDVDLHEALAVAGIGCHIAGMHDMMDRLERTSITRCFGTEDCR